MSRAAVQRCHRGGTARTGSVGKPPIAARPLVLALLALLAVGSLEAAESNWPGWRGNGSGVSTDGDLPTRWSDSKNVDWSVRVDGHGHSSPIVWGDTVFLTSAVEGPARTGLRSTVAVAMWILALVSIACLTLSAAGVPGTKSPTFVRHLLPGISYVTLAVVLLAGLVVLGRAFLPLTPLIYRAEQHHGSVFDYAFALKACFVCGALSLLLIRRFFGPRVVSAARGASTRTTRFLSGADRGFLFALSGWLFAIVFFRPFGGAHWEFSYASWMVNTAVCCLAFSVAAWMTPARSRLRLLSLAAQVGILVTALTVMPQPVRDLRGMIVRDPHFPVFIAGNVVVTLWLAVQRYLSPSRRAPAPTRSSLGYASTMALGILYFTSSNLLLPEAVVRYEVLAVDSRSGETRWTTTVAKSPPGGLHPLNSAATATPVTDGERVYAHFGAVGTYCLNMNGAVQWDYEPETLNAHWGTASSPVLWNDLLILTFDGDSASSTVALDKQDGNRRWSVAHEPDSTQPDSYGTPILWETGGETQLISFGSGRLRAYDPRTGTELWNLPHPAYQIVGSPVAGNDILVVANRKFTAGIRLDREGSHRRPRVIWELPRGRPDVSSPVIYDGFVYMVTDGGIATAVNATTGRVVWKARLSPSTYYSSVTAGDGKVYFTNRDGATTVVSAGPVFRELGRNRIDTAPVSASLAVAGGDVFLRTERELYRIRHTARMAQSGGQTGGGPAAD